MILKNKLTPGNKSQLLDLPTHSIQENRVIWDNYDWSRAGEEWTEHVRMYRRIDPEKWKSILVKEMILKYIKTGSSILEIGPGAGRWTEILSGLAGRLVLADISKTCIDICKERFKTNNNIEFNLIENDLDFLTDRSIDAIWSYDVFVHINPSDIDAYLEEFQRILKHGSYGIIHHAGSYSSEKEARHKGFRSYMNGDLFAELVTKHGMKMVEQNAKIPHYPGDLISVFTLP